MGFRRRLLCVFGLIGLLAGVGTAARAASGGVHWGSAIEVPGTAILNPGGSAAVSSISCPSTGNCAAGGFYRDGSGFDHALVVGEKSGVWRHASEVPGMTALNLGRDAQVRSVSCARTGDCAAGGFYRDGSGQDQAFVVESGAWGSAIEVPGIAALNLGGSAGTNAISCARTGNCAAGGFYMDGSFHWQAFVVSEKSGVWRNARAVPGLASLNLGGQAFVFAISCASAGNCAAGGYYRDGSVHDQAFVVSETKGVWRKAIEVPGTAALNLGGAARVTSVSCTSTGNCAAGGYYHDGSGHSQTFVVSEKSGVWRKAIKVPGTAALNVGGFADVNSISCASTGNCAAGGQYSDGSLHYQAFVVSETKGVWRKAIEVPGTAALNVGGFAGVNSISCASTGNCVAGGSYSDSSAHSQAFVVSEKSGVWRKASELRGTAVMNAGGQAAVTSISCGSTGSCAAGGYYTDGSSNTQPFVTSP